MLELYIEQFNDDDVKRYGMCPSDYGVFDNTGHCYFYGSKTECEKYLIRRKENNMLETKYIPQENANIIVNILKKAQQINKLVKFKVIDDESAGVLYYGDNPEKAVHEMDGVDCNFGVNCVEDLGYDHDNKVVGWFFFTPYEEVDCVLCDHTDNEFCNQCVK